MTSAIVYSTIDAAFPKAGKDNNSQGFRDNFQVIKTGLQTANGEITTLQSVTAKLTATNDFNQNILSNAEFNKFYGSVRDNGSITTTTDVDIENGPLQIYTLGANCTLTLTNWPASDKYAKIRIHLKQDTTNLSTVSITGTAGQFQCATGIISGSSVGQAVKVTGTISGSATISGYASGNIYYIIGTPTDTTFTLSSTFGGSAITTTAGTTTGLTFTLLRTVTFGTEGGASVVKSGDGASFPSPFVLSNTSEKVVEAWTYDGSTSKVFLKYLGDFS